jgi:hypothetical protein
MVFASRIVIIALFHDWLHIFLGGSCGKAASSLGAPFIYRSHRMSCSRVALTFDFGPD